MVLLIWKKITFVFTFAALDIKYFLYMICLLTYKHHQNDISGHDDNNIICMDKSILKSHLNLRARAAKYLVLC